MRCSQAVPRRVPGADPARNRRRAGEPHALLQRAKAERDHRTARPMHGDIKPWICPIEEKCRSDRMYNRHKRQHDRKYHRRPVLCPHARIVSKDRCTEDTHSLPSFAGWALRAILLWESFRTSPTTYGGWPCQTRPPVGERQTKSPDNMPSSAPPSSGSSTTCENEGILLVKNSPDTAFRPVPGGTQSPASMRP